MYVTYSMYVTSLADNQQTTSLYVDYFKIDECFSFFSELMHGTINSQRSTSGIVFVVCFPGVTTFLFVFSQPSSGF